MSRFVLYSPLLMGVLLAVPGVLGWLGRLPKNDWVGIRMDVVMRSERAWVAGHRAGGPWLVVAGLVACAGTAVLAVLHPQAATANAIAAAAVGSAFLLAGVAAWRAQSAARRAE